MKLNQLLAIEKTQQSETHSVVTKSHHSLTAGSQTEGMTRTYAPLDDADPGEPDESKLVQVRAGEEIQRVREAWGALFNVTAKKDWTNQMASADVILPDGTILIESAPVPYLLWLEKKLNDVLTYVTKLPTLDPNFEWEYDENRDTYVTKPVETARNKKEPRVVQLAPATKEHKEQVQVFNEDKRVGTWITTRLSGGMPRKDITALRERVLEVQKAVKQAREQANLTEVVDIETGDAVFSHIFG